MYVFVRARVRARVCVCVCVCVCGKTIELEGVAFIVSIGKERQETIHHVHL